MAVYFCASSVIGHWLEITYCPFMRLFEGRHSSGYQGFVAGYQTDDWLADIKTMFATSGVEYTSLQAPIYVAMIHVERTRRPDIGGGYSPYSSEYGTITPYPGCTTTTTNW